MAFFKFCPLQVFSSISVIVLVGFIFGFFYVDYKYDLEIGSYWNLSVKASTLELKSEYLNKFVQAIKNAKLANYDAVVFKTPDNRTKDNFEILLSLQKRMNEVKKMDIISFEDQQTILQVTGQKQVIKMLSTLEGAWKLQNFPLFWDWIFLLISLTLLFLSWLGIIILISKEFVDKREIC